MTVGRVVKVIKCHKPKMSDHRGRTWDSISVILPNGQQINGYLDTTWGHYVYFVMDNHWRKVSLDHFGSEYKIDLRGRVSSKWGLK